MIRGAREAVEHKRGRLPDARITHAKVTVRSAEVTPAPVYRKRDIQQIRGRLGLSQTLFAELIGASPATVRAWERGAREPSDMARRLLEVADRQPGVFTHILKST